MSNVSDDDCLGGSERKAVRKQYSMAINIDDVTLNLNDEEGANEEKGSEAGDVSPLFTNDNLSNKLM